MAQSFSTTPPERYSRHGKPSEDEYHFRHVKWPQKTTIQQHNQKNEDQVQTPPQAALAQHPTQTIRAKKANKAPRPEERMNSTPRPSQNPARTFSTPLATEPKEPSTAAISRVPLTTIPSKVKPTQNVTWDIPLDAEPLATPDPITPLTRPAERYSIAEQTPAAQLPIVHPKKATPTYLSHQHKGLWKTLSDPQEGLPILGVLSLIPLIGIPFGIAGILIGIRKKNKPLRKRSERGFWAACTGFAIQGSLIGIWLATFLWKWAMNDIQLLYDLLM